MLRLFLCPSLYNAQGWRLNTSRRLKAMNRIINVRPVVSLAAKLVGTGPTRLKMVKLSHQLNNDVVQF
jgi:hypothetical protein